jgi:hypothetical protein
MVTLRLLSSLNLDAAATNKYEWQQAFIYSITFRNEKKTQQSIVSETSFAWRAFLAHKERVIPQTNKMHVSK